MRSSSFITCICSIWTRVLKSMAAFTSVLASICGTSWLTRVIASLARR